MANLVSGSVAMGSSSSKAHVPPGLQPCTGLPLGPDVPTESQAYTGIPTGLDVPIEQPPAPKFPPGIKVPIPPPYGPHVPTGPLHPEHPPGLRIPTGLRSDTQLKRLSPGAMKLGNRQIPSVLSPVPLPKVPYEEAIENILEETGPLLSTLNSLPAVPTSVVLHDPRGGVLKATEALLLQTDVTLCYLITWLQIFTDNYVAKYNPGNELVVRSVEFRFHNKQIYAKYPNLEGGLSYFPVNGVVGASVNWPCGNSPIEQYWGVFRSMMQLGGHDQIKYPIIRVRTVKYLAGDPDGTEPNKGLGGGHVFTVGQKDLLDVQQYYNYYGQPVPGSLTRLDKWLTDSDNRKLPQSTIDIEKRQHGQGSNTNLSFVGSNTGSQFAGGLTRTNPALVRQPPSRIGSVPIGDHTTDVSVPAEQPIKPDPRKKLRKYQCSQLHNAFPLNYMIYDPKDMLQIPIFTSVVGKPMAIAGGQYNQQNGWVNVGCAGDDKNVNTDHRPVNVSNNNATSKDAYESAIGFSSDDDETFFPARNMREDASSADINRLPRPLHRHGHRPSQNKNIVKENKQKQSRAEPNTGDPTPGPAKAGFVAPGKTIKKSASTMNVNAPEFINRPSITGSGLGSVMNYHGKGFSKYNTPVDGFVLTNKFNPYPFPQHNPPPFMAVPPYAFPSPYPPGSVGFPSSWAPPTSRPNPSAISHPPAGPPKPPNMTTRHYNFRTRGGRARENIARPNSIGDLRRHMAQDIPEVTTRSETRTRRPISVRGERPFIRDDDKYSPISRSNNDEGPEDN